MKLFTKDRSFYRSLLSLAIPVALQNLITFGVTLADNLMVGRLGDAAVSGVYAAGQLQTFLQMFSVGIEGAILILSAQYWGKRDTDNIKKITSIGLLFSLSVGLLFNLLCFFLPREILSVFTNQSAVIDTGTEYLRIVCFSYAFFCVTQGLIATMRSVETARIGMVVSGISFVINVILNKLLIFGAGAVPAMGVQGAALATLFSRMAETLCMSIYVLTVDKKLCIRPRELAQFDKGLFRDFVCYGLPIVGGQIVWSINLMANTAILGRFSQEVITAASVANTMNALAYVVMNGMSSAVGIITGKTVGSGQTEKMKEYARTVQILFLCLGLVTGGAIFLLKTPFVSLYPKISIGATHTATQFITVLSVTIIGTCYQAACLFGLVKSGGDVSFVFKNDMIFVFMVVLPSALLASYFGAAPWVVFACLKCDQILKCFVAVVKINRFNWMKNLTKTSQHEN